jgi:uncharacterized protein YigA (DUF484 family)
MSESLSALTVARFLQEHPEFFSEHAELFAALTVPHPNQSRAVSLGERQILTLRDRQKELEHRLAALAHQASFNENVAEKITLWCSNLLAVQDPQKLPGHLVAALAQTFEIPQVAMRIWGLDIPNEGVGAEVDDDARAFAQSLTAPYCGPNKDFAVAQWFTEMPASMAMIALTHGSDDEAQTAGLLLLGSDDTERFSSDMGTDFLQTIGRLCSAALSRLPLKAGA